MAKVSVVIPTYNVEQYLRECLDSITQQTLQEIEIICVNDGSTDSSLEIINEYAEKDPRIIVITGPNGGYGKAMNKGLDAATGEYIGIVEPDDYISLTMYEDLYEIAVKHDLDFVKADFYRFSTDDDGNLDKDYNHLSKKNEYYNRVLRPLEEKECFRFIMNTWSGIYRREFLEKYHIRHNETPGASFQDNGFWFQTFLLAERAMFIDRPYYMNRRDNPNSSVKSRDKVYCVNEEYKYIKNLILERYPALWHEVQSVHALKRLHNYDFTLSRIAPEFKKQYIADISKEFRENEVLGELDKTFFTAGEWKQLQNIKNNPDGYYLKKVQEELRKKTTIDNNIEKTKKELEKAKKDLEKTKRKLNVTEKELHRILNTTTYKVGRFIMFIPCTVKDWVIKGSK